MRPLVLTAAMFSMYMGIARTVPIIAEAADPKSGCLSYGDPSVSLSGTVFTRIYFGPPGYGETPTSDAREYAILILLDAPVCAKASANPGLDNNAYEGNIVLVQLAAVHVTLERLRDALGQRATVRGSLYHALTAHHRTPVVMDVYSVAIP